MPCCNGHGVKPGQWVMTEEHSRWSGQSLVPAYTGAAAPQLPAPSVPAAWHGGTAAARLGCS